MAKIAIVVQHAALFAPKDVMPASCRAKVNAATYPSPVRLGSGITVGELAARPWGEQRPVGQLLLFGTGGTAFVFTGVPTGKYNLALYGIDGAYATAAPLYGQWREPIRHQRAQDVFLIA